VSDDQTPATTDSADEVEASIAAVTDGAFTLFVADFNDTDTAWEAYEALKEIEDGRHVEIEGVLVVKREADGTVQVQKATDHSTRRGLAWGVVGGVVLGVIFPPSIIGSAVVLGAGGAAIGKARELHHRDELAAQLESAIMPGHSGIVALVSDPGVIEIRKALAKANGILESSVDKVVAKDIKAAAKEAEVEAEKS
jgi:uncharacterized membrane protein